MSDGRRDKKQTLISRRPSPVTVHGFLFFDEGGGAGAEYVGGRGSPREVRPEMKMSREEAVGKARADLARRLGVSEGEVKEVSVEDTEFPDMALGAGTDGEMSGQMMTPGWRIRLSAGGGAHEYRSDGRQLRLYNFKGSNYRV
jgi:hypothetical protein